MIETRPVQGIVPVVDTPLTADKLLLINISYREAIDFFRRPMPAL